MADTLPAGPAAGPIPAAALCGEDERAAVLASFGLDALEDDAELAAITRFAAKLCDTPIAVVSMVEADRQRFIARDGLGDRETPRSESFCAHAMLTDEAMIVVDASGDARFSDNELVRGAPHIRFYAGMPLHSREGVPLGALAVIDSRPRPEGLTELQRHGLEVLAQAVMCRMCAHRVDLATTARASESARAMREIADMVPGIVWSADSEGRFDYFNNRWNLITGAAKPETIGDWIGLVHDDDVAHTRAAWQKSFAGGLPFECEYRLRQLDGSWRWTLARALPMHDAHGKLVRWYGTLTDIDERHRRAENRDLLARELSHRIKNIFAVVAGLISLRARRHPAAAAFARDLTDTIRALGRAHDFVRPMEGVKEDSLRGLLIELMAPYANGDGRVSVTGDDCPIGPRAATPLALTFHELATNSAKYGALSVDGGSVSIALACPAAGETASIAWREIGGPAVAEPGEEGFGSRLIRSAVEGQLRGRLVRRFASTGLEVDLAVPLPAIRA